MSASWHCAHPGTRPCCPLLPLLCDPAGPDLPGKLCPDRGVPGQPGQSWRFSAAHLHYRDTHSGQPGSAASGASSMGGLSYRVCRWAQADAACPEPAWGASQITFRSPCIRKGYVLFSKARQLVGGCGSPCSTRHAKCRASMGMCREACRPDTLCPHEGNSTCLQTRGLPACLQPRRLPACLPNPHPAYLPASLTLTPPASIP